MNHLKRYVEYVDVNKYSKCYRNKQRMKIKIFEFVLK